MLLWTSIGAEISALIPIPENRSIANIPWSLHSPFPIHKNLTNYDIRHTARKAFCAIINTRT